MYSFLLPEFHLSGALRRIPTVVPYSRAVVQLSITLSLNPAGSGESLQVQKEGTQFHLTETLRRIPTGVRYCGALLILKRKYTVHQLEPLYLARLNTTGRLPGIPEGAVTDRLTHCHSSLRHSTHTVGLGIVFQCLLL